MVGLDSNPIGLTSEPKVFAPRSGWPEKGLDNSGFYSNLCSGLSCSFNPGCCPNTGSLSPVWQVEGKLGCWGKKSASQPLLRGPDSPPKNTFSEVKVKIRDLATRKEGEPPGAYEGSAYVNEYVCWRQNECVCDYV